MNSFAVAIEQIIAVFVKSPYVGLADTGNNDCGTGVTVAAAFGFDLRRCNYRLIIWLKDLLLRSRSR